MNILFEYPAAFAALGAMPVLLAIYLLRNRFRPFYVSGLMLWDVQRRHKQGGLNLDRLQTPLLFALELLALMLLALAATGPLLRTGSDVRRMVIVLDDSFSMQAGGSATSLQTGRDELLRYLRLSEPFNVTLIRAGAEPEVTGADLTGMTDVSSALAQWTGRSPAADLDKAVALAGEIADERARVLIISDHVRENLQQGQTLEHWAVGRPLDNAGFIHAERTGDRCILVIGNYSTRARTVTLAVDAQAGGDRLLERQMEIAPDEPYRMIFEAPSGADIVATLEDDALAADNRVVLLASKDRPVRVATDIASPRLAESVDRVLEAVPAVRRQGLPADLLITDSVLPVETGGQGFGWTLEIIAEPNVLTFGGPFIVDRNHPLAEGLDLQGVIWSAPSGRAMRTVPIVSAGNTGLLEARQDRDGTCHVRLYYDHALSTLDRSLNWPVLFYNLVQWRRQSLPGLERANWRLGSQVRFESPHGTERLQVVFPDGRQIAQDDAQQAVVEADQAGVYQVLADGDRTLFAVNALSADESDLRGCRTVRQQAADQAQLFWWEYRRYDKLLLLAAAILLALHGLAVYAQSKGGA